MNPGEPEAMSLESVEGPTEFDLSISLKLTTMSV